MKKLLAAAVLAAAVLAPGLVLGEKEKQPAVPFYRKYLVAGIPLDDRILLQEKRVESNPDSADLRNDFGNLLAARRFPKEAREQYVLAMKLDRHHFLAPYNLGLLYETQGQTRKAISAYQKSVDRNRGFPPSRFRLGRLYEKSGSPQKAIRQYARALQIDPDMRDPRRNPLIVDTQLLAQVSLENYPLDLASASMATEAAYLDRGLMRKLPLDRTLSSEDLKPSPAGPPAGTPPAGPTPVQVIAPSSPPRREPGAGALRNQPAMPAEPTPDVVVPGAESEEAPPPLPTPDPSGGRPLYVGGAVRPAPPPTPTPVSN